MLPRVFAGVFACLLPFNLSAAAWTVESLSAALAVRSEEDRTRDAAGLETIASPQMLRRPEDDLTLMVFEPETRFTELESALKDMFPVLDGYEFTHRWGGLMGVPVEWRPFAYCDRSTGFGAGVLAPQRSEAQSRSIEARSDG